MKTCSKCGVEKDLEDFHRNRHGSEGRDHQCRECRAEYRNKNRKRINSKAAEYNASNREQINRRQRQYNEEKRGEIRSRHLLREYGISSHDYEQMVQEQGGVCSICGETETMRRRGKLVPLSVDHCHESGRVRALLCSTCNTVLGKMKDSPDLLRKAADYLEHHHSRLGVSK